MAKVLISEEILQETAEAIKNKANIVVVGGLRPVHFAATINRIGATTGLPALPDNSEEPVYDKMHLIFDVVVSEQNSLPRKLRIRGGNCATPTNMLYTLGGNLLILHIDKGITSVVYNSIRALSKLRLIRISEDVTTLAEGAFSNLSVLEFVIFDGVVPPTMMGNPFSSCPNIQGIIVPAESNALYVEALAPYGYDPGKIVDFLPEDYEDKEDGTINLMEQDILTNYS